MWNRTMFAWLLHPFISTRLLDGKVAILHVGKNGGSEILRRLGHASTDRLMFLTHDFAQAAFKDGRCGLGRRRQFVFFVRDPVQRFVSGWLDRYRMGRPAYYEAHSGLEERSFALFPTPDALGCALSSSEPSVAGAAREAMGAHRHVKGLGHYLGNASQVMACFGRVLFVGRAEHLDEDFPRLAEMLVARRVLAEMPMSQTQATRSNAAPSELAPLKHLGACAVRNLRAWFRDDYELLRRVARRGGLPASYPAELEELALRAR